MTTDRHCCICGSELTLCFGFVLARDFVDDVEKPREVCGSCVEKALLGIPIEIPIAE